MRGRIIFMTEEPSMGQTLRNLLPKVCPEFREFEHWLILNHQGKSDLERSFPKKMRNWQEPGIKFIIIEELSNIDDTNFNIFPEIAKQFGYQLMTMTPKPFGSYTNEEWYLHMLVKGKDDKERNYTPMSFFKTKYKKVELDKYLTEQNELEGTKAT